MEVGVGGRDFAGCQAHHSNLLVATLLFLVLLLSSLYLLHKAHARAHVVAIWVFEGLLLLSLNLFQHIFLICLLQILFCGANETWVKSWVLVRISFHRLSESLSSRSETVLHNTVTG